MTVGIDDERNHDAPREVAFCGEPSLVTGTNRVEVRANDLPYDFARQRALKRRCPGCLKTALICCVRNGRVVVSSRRNGRSWDWRRTAGNERKRDRREQAAHQRLQRNGRFGRTEHETPPTQSPSLHLTAKGSVHFACDFAQSMSIFSWMKTSCWGCSLPAA